MTGHCEDKPADRAKGDRCERAFKVLVDSWGYRTELHPSDLSLWVDARVWPYPHLHEIKGKTPTARGCFGLEVYRLEELLERDMPGHPTFYTVHNDSGMGVDAWLTVRVNRLPRSKQFRARWPSYHGTAVSMEDGFLWPATFFESLAGLMAPSWWWRKGEAFRLMVEDMRRRDAP